MEAVSPLPPVILDLRYDPDPILGQVCKEIPEINAAIQTLAILMQETMVAEKGAGLAAPQIGHALQMFVTFNPKVGQAPLVFINPKILVYSWETEVESEGCLSFPGRPVQVKRHKRVKVKARNEAGLEFVLKAEGFLARCIQHEMDHLAGKTIHPLVA